MIMDFAAFERYPGGCEWFDRHEKFVGQVSLYFQLDLNTPGSFIVHADKNVRTEISALLDCTCKSE